MKTSEARLVRILVVVDDAVIRTKLRDLLEQRPKWVVVGEAHNGRHAVEIFDQHMPHVTVMDFQMPEMNGLEAARRLTSAHPDSPILLVTLYLSKQLDEEARKVGIKGTCSKIRIDCVVQAVEALLRGDVYFGSAQSAA
jgi:two-component system, NarL family, response regulator YdfI